MTVVLARHRSTLERVPPWAAVMMDGAAVLAGFLLEAAPARRFVVSGNDVPSWNLRSATVLASTRPYAPPSRRSAPR